ncbi:efflux RND transporter permease subunit [Desulfobotulus sp. H1]|uniref:Efflux RND transporter permease subunit n=1 Tax=Desulfobotulus pelophilus TaxID=2823377 RepID=A0ABT3N6C9_9BACT|nr:efflux RND transporter permease subunit [Desulfobotulus pelophilus]MCW7753013.1 efflux RND transporter permease subunit [Desulfobotulus pelophilus]
MNKNLRGVIPWFTTNPVAANLLLLLVIVLGLFELTGLRKEAFPSLEPNSLTISVTYDSGSASQSEEGLAIKIEDQLEGVSGIKRVTSMSTRSGSTITIEKRDGYDLDVLLRDVKTKVDAISNFPADAERPVIEKAEREEHALWIQLYGDTDRRTLQYLADSLKTELLSRSEVNRVRIYGWLDPMMSIEIDEGQLQAYGLSLSDVERRVREYSTDIPSPTMRSSMMYFQLKASEQAYTREAFAAIPLVRDSGGAQVLLGDVARVRDTFTDDTAVLSRYNGCNSMALQVITTGGDDISDSVAGAVEVVAGWTGNGKLPGGVNLTTWYDRSNMIEDRLQLLGTNALTGFAMVFVLLALFLNLSVAFWVAAGLPFIFVGAFYFMGDAFAGLSINEITTFGFIMALGIVVDDAVVVGESVYTERSVRGDRVENTIRGTLRVTMPTIFGYLTTVAAFYAISQISGHLGQIYAQFATVVVICLSLSLIESKLILPAHLAHLNTRPYRSRNRVIRAWQRVQSIADRALNGFTIHGYGFVVEKALHYRYAVLILFMAVFMVIITMPLTGAVRMSFFPDMAGDIVRAELTMEKDSSYGQTHAALLLLEQSAIQTDLDLRKGAGSPAGIASLQVISEADQSGSIKVELLSNTSYDISSFTLRWRELAGMPEGAHSLSIQNKPAMVDALRIELRADDDEILVAAGREVRKRLRAIPAVSGMDDNLEPGQPQLHLQLTREGRAMGFTMEMLAEQVLQSFQGQVVQRFQRKNDEMEVRVRYPDSSREHMGDVLQARLRTEDGRIVPLSAVATVRYGYTRDTITRINGKRAVYVSADVDKNILSATELVVQLQEFMPELKRQYPGLDIHFAGEAEQQSETQTSMIRMFLLAMLMIYFLLAIPLKSYVQPLLIMTAIPFGIIGAMLGHWLNDLSLGILSLNGIIALAGVIVNNSLLLVVTFNSAERKRKNIKQSISEACSSRLRAVLLTSLTTCAGLFPLLKETSLQAQFLIPAAVSLAYGIMFGTIVTLVLIPVLLMIHDDVCMRMKRMRYFLRFSRERQSLC